MFKVFASLAANDEDIRKRLIDTQPIVDSVVKAMKEFSHPSQDKCAVDLARSIASTITVATNEWKYVADVKTDFDPSLPLVYCVPGEINQVVLNMLVNAAHASDSSASVQRELGIVRLARENIFRRVIEQFYGGL